MVYAVGDIHGRADLLDSLLAVVDADADAFESSTVPMLVFLGDLIDRGDNSKGVIERVLGLQAGARFEVRVLKGNHEEAMLRFLASPADTSEWLTYGGIETLNSYGVAAGGSALGPARLEALSSHLRTNLPEPHLRLLGALERYVLVGEYLFVHAGVRPGVALAEQADRDLFWIRDRFLAHNSPSPYIVVHGHTPTEEPELLPHRIGVDTGAYATGVLTAVRIVDNERSFLQSRRGA